MRGLPYQGHDWFYCTGCGRPTINNCCGYQLEAWFPGRHGDLPTAIRQAHQGGHRFGYQPGYGGFGGYNDFLGTFLVVDGIADGDIGEVMLGSMMGGGGGFGLGTVAGLVVAEELFDVFDERDDHYDGDYD